MKFNLVETLEEGLYHSGYLILGKYSEIINKDDFALKPKKQREVLEVHERFRLNPPIYQFSIYEDAILSEAQRQELDVTDALGYISELYGYAKELKQTNIPGNVAGTAMFVLVSNFLTGRFETENIPYEEKMKIYRGMWEQVMAYVKQTPSERILTEGMPLLEG